MNNNNFYDIYFNKKGEKMEINKEIKSTQTEKEIEFKDSELVLKNRKLLNISGVEKVYEANEGKIQLCVAGMNLIICGEQLSVERLNVADGTIEISGNIFEIKYNANGSKNFLKKIFK